MAQFNLSIAAIVWIVVISVILFFAYIASRYQKFKTNEYVIHFRHGKIISKGRGGKVIKLPLTDEIVVIPTTTQKTLLDSNEKILSREYQDIKISAILYWRVTDPALAFNQVVWAPQWSQEKIIVQRDADFKAKKKYHKFKKKSMGNLWANLKKRLFIWNKF